MSMLNETFHTLLNWNIYKTEESFKRYITENNLPEEAQKILVAVYEELEKFKKSDGMMLVDASVLNKAIQIKNHYEPLAQEVIQSNDIEEKVVEKVIDPKPEITHEQQSNESNESVVSDFLNHNEKGQSAQKTFNSEFEKLEFRGNSMEYFKIWIVNMFLTIVTIGIYSAWAKVRTNRYFYANTYYQNSSFEYTADPKSILKGRLIVFAIYALFVFSAQVLLSPILTLLIFVFALGITPWIINRAIRFKLKTVKHRNINFHYNEDSKEFYKFFGLHFVINLVTVGLAYPYSLNKFKALVINSSNFGGITFSYVGETKGMYMQFLKVIGGYLILLIPVAIVAGIFPMLVNLKEAGKDPELLAVLMIGLTIGIYAFTIFFGLFIKGLYDAFISNYVWSKTHLQDILFESSYSPAKLAWIYISNVFAIIFSLGLLTPWAKVRVTKYKCQYFAIAAENMSSFIATAQEDQSAIGEETGDFFDMDIGI